MSTPDAPWRVYLPEWLVVWISDALGPEGRSECLQHFQDKYQGRVREQGWRVIPAVLGMEPSRSPSCVQLYVPNLQGEYKDQDYALAQVISLACLDRDAEMVQRGSDREQALLSYSKKMLRDAGAGGGKR
jgi:hypothetical protein